MEIKIKNLFFFGMKSCFNCHFRHMVLFFGMRVVFGVFL